MCLFFLDSCLKQLGLDSGLKKRESPASEPMLGVNASISNHIFTLFSAKTHLFGQIWTRGRDCLQHPHLPMQKKTHPADKLANPLLFSPSAQSPLSLLSGGAHPGA